MTEILKHLWNDEAGQGMVEYGLIIALVALVVIGALIAIGDSLDGLFTGIGDTLAGTETSS